jgi:hypothetical protein
MQRHHEIEFAQFIETLFADGAVSLRWDQLYRWFGASRISKGIWQRIFQAWSDTAAEYRPHSEIPKIWVMKFPNSFTIVREAYKTDEVWALTEDGESSYTRR